MVMTLSDLLLIRQAREDALSGRARELRIAAGLSQAEIAAAADVDQTTISTWELGRRRPRGEAALRYAKVLHWLAAGQR
jgi:transcriptional regulator with XRE-family HTH domain